MTLPVSGGRDFTLWHKLGNSVYQLVSTLEKKTSLINCGKLLTELFTTEETRVFFTFKDVSYLCGFVNQYIQLREKTEENVKSSSVIQICFG